MVRHAIFGYLIVMLLMGVFIFSNKVEGVIEYKVHQTRFSDTVYYFIINGKSLEVSRYNYNKYKIDDYFKQGILE